MSGVSIGVLGKGVSRDGSGKCGEGGWECLVCSKDAARGKAERSKKKKNRRRSAS